MEKIAGFGLISSNFFGASHNLPKYFFPISYSLFQNPLFLVPKFPVPKFPKIDMHPKFLSPN